MQIFVKLQNGTLVASLVGELDEHSADLATKQLDDAINNNNFNKFVWDMSRLSFMDSTGIGVLIGRYKLTKSRNIPMYVTNVSTTVNKILKMSGLYNIITLM